MHHCLLTLCNVAVLTVRTAKIVGTCLFTKGSIAGAHGGFGQGAVAE